MNLERASEIINDYGAILEQKAESGLIAAPMSMLPYTKNKIKTAITYLLLWPTSRLTANMKKHLETSYILLADFVEEGDALIANNFHEWACKATKEKRLRDATASFPEGAERASEITDAIYRDSENLLKELRTTGQIITYRNQGAKGMFCQIRLNSGERILISIAETGVKISKLAFGGLVPAGTIWESGDARRTAELFGDISDPDAGLLDAIVSRLIRCRSLSEVKQQMEI